MKSIFYDQSVLSLFFLMSHLCLLLPCNLRFVVYNLFSQLMEMTKFKAEWAGKVVLLVAAHNTTQLCSRCGEIVKKSLAVRMHNCPVCGLILDRDHNAAINILNKVGQGLPKLTPVEMFVGTSAKQEAPSERVG